MSAYDPEKFGRVLTRLDYQDQDIAEIKARVQANTSKLDRIVALNEAHESVHAGVSAKLDEILAFQNKQKGAVNIIMVLATAVSGVVGWFVSYFSK